MTAGPVQPSTLTAFIRDVHGNALASIYGDRGDAAVDEHAVARTLLVADAFDAFNETGLTPRQLAERCKELLAAIALALPYVEKVAGTAPTEYNRMGRQRQAVKDVSAIRAAIAKNGGAA